MQRDELKPVLISHLSFLPLLQHHRGITRKRIIIITMLALESVSKAIYPTEKKVHVYLTI